MVDRDRLRSDVARLSSIERGAASTGERASAEWVAARLRELGAVEVRLETFRYQRTWAWRHVAHHVAGLTAARVGGFAGGALGLAAGVSYEMEVAGRSQWLRSLLPAGEGTNVVARVPAAGEAVRRTVVLVAHHDAARTGWLWSSPFMSHADRRAWERGGSDSMALTPEAAFALIALGSLTGRRLPRYVGAVLLGVAAGLALDVARSDVVPGANDNATGVAAVLALVERFGAEPLAGAEVVLVVPGCEEVGLGGMSHWLAERDPSGGRRRQSPVPAGSPVDPGSTLVVNLDTLGSGTPVVVSRETPFLGRYRAEDLAWADRGADLAGVERPPRMALALPTDAIVAAGAGVPALTITSKDADGRFPNYHLTSDLPDAVDYGSVEACLTLAEGTVRAFAEAR